MAAQARLDVKVTGDASGALKAIQSVRAAGNEAVTKFREQSKEAIGAVVRSLNPIVLIGTSAATAIMSIGQKISEYFEEGREQVKKAGEELTKNAQAVGVTEQAYQQLRSAAERAGVAQDEFNAKLALLKEGKATVAELVAEWGKLPEKIGLTTDAIERYQLEAAAMRQRREAEDAEADRNLSAVSRQDKLVGEFWARVNRGENANAVADELVERRASGWWGNGLEAEELRARLQTEWLEREATASTDGARANERRRRETAAQAAARAKAEADASRKQAEAEWRNIEAAGSIDAFALAVAARTAGLGDDYAQWDVNSLRLGDVYKQWQAYAEEVARRAGKGDPGKRAQTAADLAKGYAAYLKAAQDAADKAEREAAEKRKKAAEAEAKAAEERRKRAEELQAKRDELQEWYKAAKAEAEEYSGGYQNAFGLAFGGGDLIGSGRFRAVTRMTEAAKQLQVSEKLLEVNRQMNEKLKALEE